MSYRRRDLALDAFGLLFVIALAIAFLAALDRAWSFERIELRGTVVAPVHDGDGCHVRDARGKTWVIRYEGIDAPEMEKRSGKSQWPEQPFADAARALNARLVEGQQVRVTITKMAAWFRYQGIVYTPDGRDVRQELLKAGLAWYDPRYTRDEELAQLAGTARSQRRGLWARPHIEPDAWRKGAR